MPVNRARTSSARLLPLEPRQLFTAAFDVNVNFQPKGNAPSGYVADYGKTYAAHGDLAYGWDSDNSKRMIDRKTAAALRYDTFALLGDDKSASTWEIAVPDGLYDVKVMSGDPTLTNSRYAISVEGTTVLDRAPTRTSWYRKGEAQVWVSDGKLTLTSATGAVNNKINSVEIAQIDPHVTGQDIVNPVAMQGMVVNEVPYKIAFPTLTALNTKSVRLWYDVKHWTDKPDDSFFHYFQGFKDAGYHVMVIFSTPSVPKAKDVKAFFSRVLAHPGVTDMIDLWQIGNEMNLPDYWAGTYEQYVDRVLKPAYEVIHPTGEPVVGGGITYDVTACQQLQSLGYSDYCDYAAFHPYGESGDIVVQRATDAKAAFDGKPLIISEWNVQGLTWTPDAWAHEVQVAAQGLSQVAYLNYYYALRNDATNVGTGGAVTIKGKKNNPFYDVVQGWGDGVV